jgi:glutamate-1-semialdehyde aminotransferase
MNAFAGRSQVMEAVAPHGRAVHSGTFGHLLPMIAAQAFLKLDADPTFWTDLRLKEQMFYAGLRRIFSMVPYPVWVQATGARFGLLFGLERERRSYRDVACCDRELERRFYCVAFARGVYFHWVRHHGSSAAHTQSDLERALTGIQAAAKAVRPTSGVEASPSGTAVGAHAGVGSSS